MKNLTQLEQYTKSFRKAGEDLKLVKHDNGTTMLFMDYDNKKVIDKLEFDKSGKEVTRDYNKAYSIDLGLGF